METLSRDSYTTRGKPAGQDRRDGLVMFALLFVSCALLVFSRLDIEPVHWLRWRLIGAVSPVLEVAAVPVSRLRQAGHRVVTTIGALSEIEQLRADNQRLRGWEWRARELERKLAQVSLLARASEEIGLEFATGRVIADAKGPFANSLLVNLGTRDGIQAGFAAVSGDGLIGHVIDVGESAARILLLNDPNSRIAVLAGPATTRAILKGDGAGVPRLTHIAGSAPVPDAASSVLRNGDVVLTSGDDGLLPRGLKIGAVKLEDEGPRVVLAARLQGLEFVSLLFFTPPTLAPKMAPKTVAKTVAKTVGGTVADGVTNAATQGKMEPTSGRRGPAGGAPGWPLQ